MRVQVFTNRKLRRAALKRGKALTAAAPTSTGTEENERGLAAQVAGRHRDAIKHFTKAIGDSGADAEAHFGIALSWQELGESEKARHHLSHAVRLGADSIAMQQAVLDRPAVGARLSRIRAAWPQPLSAAELFGLAGIAALADDALLVGLMRTFVLCHAELEHLLTRARMLLLGRARENAGADPAVLAFCCALAQQCFLNEYVFACSADETRQAAELRARLESLIATGGEIAPLTVVAVAAYGPLHTLAGAEVLLDRAWPDSVAELMQPLVREPLDELRDRAAIPILTPIADRVSREVRAQYEDNPYPRWSVAPPVGPGLDNGKPAEEILIAGCGTGKHVIDVAREYPHARILAIDVSLASLAYARRKTREAGLHGVDYAQADILELGALARSFDRIESVGVLHHLADPPAGLRSLLPLLRPDGVMRIGLYSELARAAVVAGRALIAGRGAPTTADGIRAFRQEIFRLPRAAPAAALTAFADFYSTSGCRDLLFNVMEHRFTLPQIKALLAENGLVLHRLVVRPEVMAAFVRRFPDAAATTDLDCWHAFERANPTTFLQMYEFEVRKARLSGRQSKSADR